MHHSTDSALEVYLNISWETCDKVVLDAQSTVLGIWVSSGRGSHTLNTEAPTVYNQFQKMLGRSELAMGLRGSLVLVFLVPDILSEHL